MDHDAAVIRFEAFCPPDQDPVLSPAQVEAAISEAVTADDADLAPTDEEWTPTYSRLGVWRAITRGWEMKAGNAAGRFDFTTDGQQFRRSQVADHCDAMATKYRNKLGQSVTSS